MLQVSREIGVSVKRVKSRWAQVCLSYSKLVIFGGGQFFCNETYLRYFFIAYVTLQNNFCFSYLRAVSSGEPCRTCIYAKPMAFMHKYYDPFNPVKASDRRKPGENLSQK